MFNYMYKLDERQREIFPFIDYNTFSKLNRFILIHNHIWKDNNIFVHVKVKNKSKSKSMNKVDLLNF